MSQQLAIWDDITESYDFLNVNHLQEGLNIIDDYMIKSGSYSIKIGSKHCISNEIGTILQFYNSFWLCNQCAYFMVYRDMYTALRDQKKYSY